MIWKESIDCDIVDVCNLSCKNCSRVSPRFGKNLYSFEEFSRDITALGKVFRCNFVYVCGGEPLLLGEKLANYVEVIRDSSVCKKIGIVTNGLLLHKNSEVLKKFDAVRVSLYPHRHKERIKEWFAEYRKNYPDLTTYENNQFHEVFSTEPHSESETQMRWERCKAKHLCNNLYRGRYYRCFGAARFHIVLDSFNIANDHHAGCKIHEDNLEERLASYIDSSEKLSTCRYCLGHEIYHPWEELHVPKTIK